MAETTNYTQTTEQLKEGFLSRLTEYTRKHPGEIALITPDGGVRFFPSNDELRRATERMHGKKEYKPFITEKVPKNQAELDARLARLNLTSLLRSSS